jgi:voltage-dependent anion channel protein 2
MSTKVPAFSDIGKAAKELLYGGQDGVFQFNHVVTLKSKTADGVDFTLAATKVDGAIRTLLKSQYKTKSYGVVGTVDSAGAVTLAATLNDLAPGLNATISGAVPDQSSGKLALEYVLPHLTLKSIVGLTNTPRIDVQATTGYEGITFGVDTSYDTAKGQVTSWKAGAGYTGLDYQAAIILTDLDVVKATYAHNIDATTTAGAEISRKLAPEAGPGATNFLVGVAKRLEGGALTKLRLDNKGILSYLYEQELQPKTKFAFSGLLDATNLEKAAKVGFALSHG